MSRGAGRNGDNGPSALRLVMHTGGDPSHRCRGPHAGSPRGGRCQLSTCIKRAPRVAIKVLTGAPNMTVSAMKEILVQFVQDELIPRR